MAMATLYNSRYYICRHQLSMAMAIMYGYLYYVLLFAILDGYIYYVLDTIGYDTLPVQVYICGTCIKNINFSIFTNNMICPQKKIILHCNMKILYII